jgi:hypothetical protein
MHTPAVQISDFILLHLKERIKMKTRLLSAVLILNGLNAFPQLTYKDVASIFYARCTSCHNQSSHGPSFLSYSSTLPWTGVIQVNLQNNIMPPWTPDTTYTRFIHENKILPSEKSAILSWIAGGAVKGDTTQAPLPPVYSQYKLNGVPDIELQIPAFTSNAVTDDAYNCFSLPMGLTQDRILRAYEIIAGDPKIVHHVVVNIDTNGTTTSDLSGNCFNITGDYSIGGFAPGSPPTVFPGSQQLKMGIRIKAGSKLVMQIHYPLGSAGKPDSTKIRLYFYLVNETNVRHVNVTTPLQNWQLYIPAGSTKTFSAVYPSNGGLPGHISVFSTFPHSHTTAKEIVSYAYAATDTVRFIRINDWQFDQQGYYTFRKMPKVPAGYRLFSKHVYENTGTTPVFAGTNTTDEMLFDSFQWLDYQSGDELIDVSALMAEDTLLMTSLAGATEIRKEFYSYAFPNPFSNAVRIGYLLHKPSSVKIDIYSLHGTFLETVYNGFETSGTHEFTWRAGADSKTAPAAGTYIYIVSTSSGSSHGKIILLPGKD